MLSERYVSLQQVNTHFANLEREEIPSIRILSHMRTRTIPRNIQSIKHHIRRISNNMIPRRRMSQFQRSNGTALQTDDTHQNGTLKSSIYCKHIVPDLSVAIDCATAVDVDVFTAEFEEGGGVLEDNLEGVVDPVVCVVGELDCAGDIYH